MAILNMLNVIFLQINQISKEEPTTACYYSINNDVRRSAFSSTDEGILKWDKVVQHFAIDWYCMLSDLNENTVNRKSTGSDNFSAALRYDTTLWKNTSEIMCKTIQEHDQGLGLGLGGIQQVKTHGIEGGSCRM